MKPDIIMHVNYCEQGQTIDEMCRLAVSWGFDGIELRRTRVGVEERPEEYLHEISDAAAKHGLKKIIFGGPSAKLLDPEESVRKRELEILIDFYRSASEKFDLSICNTFAGNMVNPSPDAPGRPVTLHGSAVACEHHWEWAASAYRELGALAGELGIKLAFETHMSYLHDSMEGTLELLRRIDSPHVGVNLDYGNIINFPNAAPLEETIAAAGDKLFYVHLKNSIGLGGGPRLKTSLGGGEINNREFLRILKSRSYSGPIAIESPRSGDREWFAVEDLAYLNLVLDDLGWT